MTSERPPTGTPDGAGGDQPNRPGHPPPSGPTSGSAGPGIPDPVPDNRARRRFWLLAGSLCVGLAVVAAALGVVNARRGPDLVSATIAPERAVATGGERLVLRGRQPLAELTPDQVEVTPAVPVSVETRDTAVVVRFDRPLAHATDYTVRVHAVRSRHTGIASDWEYSFTTPGYAIYSVVGEGPWAFGPEDRVLRTAPGEEPSTVLAAPGIDAFTVVAGRVVAISRSDAQTADLLVSSEAGVETLGTPPGADIGLLHGSPEQGVIGYTLTGQDDEQDRFHDNTLFLRDLTDQALPAREVTGPGGAEIRVIDWAFIPGTRSLVIQDDSRQMYLTGLDDGADLVPLGSHDQLLGFLPGTTTLVVLDGTDEVLLDLATGATSVLATPADDGDPDMLAGHRTMIGPEEYLQQVDDISWEGERAMVTSRLVHARQGETTTIATVTPGDGWLLDSGVSGNGQYAWAEVLKPDAPVEDLTSGASDHVATTVVDLTSGETIGAVSGSHLLWVTQ